MCHMNHPGSGTAQGIAAAVPDLRTAGTASSASPTNSADRPTEGSTHPYHAGSGSLAEAEPA